MKLLTGTKPSLKTEFASELSGKRVLVTGARGFIGQHLVFALHEIGAIVFASSRNAEPETETLACDLSDADATRRLLAKAQPEYIFHLAATVTASEKMELIAPTTQNILIASINLLVAAADISCKRIVMVGTSEQPQTSQLAPLSPYSAAKEATAKYIALFKERYGLPIVTVRPFLTYGPGQNEAKLIPSIITSLQEAKPVSLSSPDRLCDIVYVDDVVRGMLKAAVTESLPAADVDLGSGSLMRIADIAQTIQKLIGSSATTAGTEADEATREQRSNQSAPKANIAASVSSIGWQPLWSLEEGLQETITWYQRKRGSSGRSR